MITHRQVTEVECHQFVAEASDLYDAAPGFRDGWPAQVPTSLGNGQPLIRVAKRVDAEGDIQYVRYAQANGCISLKIFND